MVDLNTLGWGMVALMWLVMAVATILVLMDSRRRRSFRRELRPDPRIAARELIRSGTSWIEREAIDELDRWENEHPDKKG